MTKLIDENSFRTHLRQILDVPAGASRRQMMRARDREVQKCKADVLSENTELRDLAEHRIDQVKKSYELLTEPRRFRDYLEILNDQVTVGTVDPAKFLGFATVTGDNGGVASPAQTPAADTKAHILPVLTIAEEKEKLRELRSKRDQVNPKLSKKRRLNLDKKEKEALATINSSAISAAHERAQELIKSGVTDSDAFYESVYTSALKQSESASQNAISEIEAAGLPVEAKLLDNFATAVLDSCEDATTAEYQKLEGIHAPKKKGIKRSPLLIGAAVFAIVATALVFCNVDSFISVTRQLDNDETKTPAATASDIDSTANGIITQARQVSANPSIALAVGLAPPAGSAGMAGKAESINLPGIIDYNAAIDAAYANDYPKAIKFFTSAMEKNADLYQIPYCRGVVHLSTNALTQSLADLDGALLLRNNLAAASYNKGIIHLWEGCELIKIAYASPSEQAASPHTHAASSTTQSTQAVPTKVYASDPLQASPAKLDMAAQATLSQATKKLQQAIKEFTAASMNDATLAQPLYNRALARYRLGDIAGSISDFKQALAIDASMIAASHAVSVAQETLAAPNAPVDLNKWQGVLRNLTGPIGPPGPPGPGHF
jgi:hypothetical protein